MENGGNQGYKKRRIRQESSIFPPPGLSYMSITVCTIALLYQIISQLWQGGHVIVSCQHVAVLSPLCEIRVGC